MISSDRNNRTLLTARELSTGYGKRTVLSGLSLTVRRGDFIGVVGPNGCGKTTLIRALTGVIKLWSGSVFWEEESLQNISSATLARTIAVVSQTPERHLDLPVEEVVMLGRIPHFKRFQWWPSRQDKAVSAWSLRVTETDYLRRENFQNLSGGEQQRVMIALALAQKPVLIFLDEPTLHLDINYQFEIFKLLRRLNREYQLTIFAVLHDINLAAAYCDRLIFLKEKRIWKDGAPEELITEENIAELFRARMKVMSHPVTGRPLLFPSPY